MSNIVPLKSGSAIAPIIPTSVEEVFRLAKGISDSGLAPRGMDKPEQVTVAIMTGLEIGLPPMFAIQKIAVINGRPALWGDALPALLLAKGFRLRERIEGVGDARVAWCEVIRPDGDKVERSFSVGDAKEAGLWGKAGPWKQYPARMLQMRARGFACRDGAADVLSGLYLKEEIDDAEPMRDITPARVEPLAIPDDVTDQTPVAQVEAEAPQDVEMLSDPDGFLTKLADDLALCSTAEERAEVAEAAADLVERLPASHQARARKLLMEAGS